MKKSDHALYSPPTSKQGPPGSQQHSSTTWRPTYKPQSIQGTETSHGCELVIHTTSPGASQLCRRSPPRPSALICFVVVWVRARDARRAPADSTIHSRSAITHGPWALFQPQTTLQTKKPRPSFSQLESSPTAWCEPRPGRNVRPSLTASARAATTAHELKALGLDARARPPC